MAENWMSLRAYARHRGVALSAVQKAIESRRVTAIREDGGRITGIEQIQADAQWAANTDAVEALRNGKALELTAPPAGSVAAAPGAVQAGAGVAALPASEKSTEPAPASAGDQGSFLAARVKEAELRGQLLELDKLERIGELLPRSVVQQEFGEILAQLKSAMFRIWDRKAQALAGETDPLRVHRIGTEETRKVFDEFTSRLDRPAAGVAADAGVAGEREAALP